MKISKNTVAGLGVLSALAVVGLAAILGHKALAAPAFTPADMSSATFKIVSEFEVDASIGGTNYQFIDGGITDDVHNFKTKSTMFCDGTLFGHDGIQDKLKGITLDTSFSALTSGGGNTINGILNLDYLDASGSCQNYQSKVTFAKQADGSFVSASGIQKGDACSGGADCGADGTCQKTGGECVAVAATDDDSCESKAFGFSLTWLACPLLAVADGATNQLYSLFEGQLAFSVDQLGTDGQDKVHQSWALLRDVATALIVIIALVMILSQAASVGPFDAYTVRKMLPKIVAAVILIQISWVAVKFSIDVVNAMARGIADLLYYPFGGSDKMDLFSLLSNAGVSGTELKVMNWAGLGIGIGLGAAFLFTMLGFAFTAVLALLIALFTLIFRKILIILLIIFAPIALLAWILPGTERYWKMWRDNLTKVLFMFPIVVALIAAGRIFAFVVGAQPNGSIANSGHLMNLIFVLVGFFGPLFILPKTFKWGGQAMSLAGNAISTAGTKAGAPGKAFFGKRQEGWTAERRRQSQERYTHDEKVQPKKIKKLLAAAD